MNSGPIFSVVEPNPAVSFPVCSASAQPMEEIQTRSQTFGFPSAPSISASIGFVAGSMPMCSKVLTLAWPCMFDWPARMKTLSGLLAAAALARPTTAKPRLRMMERAKHRAEADNRFVSTGRRVVFIR